MRRLLAAAFCLLITGAAWGADRVTYLATPATVDAVAGVTFGVSAQLSVNTILSGTIVVGDFVSGAVQANAGLYVVSQISGTPGGVGVYQMNFQPTNLVLGQNVQFLHPQSWTVPADFGPVNKVELLSGGGAGGLFAGSSGEGAQGATYAKVSNVSLAPGATVKYITGAGGTSAYVNGADSVFQPSGGGVATVAAKGGIGNDYTNNRTPQSALLSNGTVVHVGGAGGTSGFGLSGGGGGGAGGPNGVGGSGADNSSGGGGGGGADGGATATNGDGGASFASVAGGTAANPGNPGAAGSGGGGAIASSAGGAGSMEPLWTSNPGGVAAGPGSGGGASAYNGSFAAGAAGVYGGGGAGGGYPGGIGSDGGQGLIVITDTPKTPLPARHPIRYSTLLPANADRVFAFANQGGRRP